MLRLEYDPRITVPFGCYRCETCRVTFFGSRGPAIHAPTCPDRAKGYDGLTYLVGSEAVAAIKEWGELQGEQLPVPLMPVNLRILRDQLPLLA